MKSKFIANIGYMVFGITIILFALLNNGIYFPSSAQAIGYDIFTFALIGLGVWLALKGIKGFKNKT
jgi:hypothetical protein